LARALIMRPKVLLLDEPLGALDKRLRDSMQVELRELQQELGITFVFVTHDQEEALSMSDRIAVMERGKLLQVAEPKVLYERPASRAVADFIGIMNFFDGRVAALAPSSLSVELAGTQMTVPQEGQTRSYQPGERVVVAVRPEKIALKPGSGEAGLKGRVAFISYLGDRQQLQVSIPGTPSPVIVVTPTGAPHLRTGDEVTLAWPVEAAVVLPAD
jgi:spermidine/putrescine transport system ATP-binding protein/putrescine transport system ATP-binding protein